MKSRTFVKLMIFAVSVLLIFAFVSGCAEDEAPAPAEPTEDPDEAAEPAAPGEYPTRNVNLYIGYGLGGSSDLVARAFSSVTPEFMNVPVTVVPRPGANGTLAVAEVLSHPPDGYNILMASNTMLNIAPHTEELPYTRDDWRAVALLQTSPGAILVSEDAPFDTLDDLVEYARENPGELTYSTAGYGNSHHLVFLAFMEEAGIEMTYVPQDGDGPAMTALLGGHVDVVQPDIAQWYNHQDMVKALAFTMRTPALPDDIPTTAEAGYDVPEFATWKGLVAHADTPDHVVEYWAEVAEKVCESESFLGIFDSLGYEATFMGPEDFRAFLDDEYDVMGRFIDVLE